MSPSRTRFTSRLTLVGLGGVLTFSLVVATGAGAASAAPGDAGFLGGAEDFSVLASSTVTNSGAGTMLDLDVGVSAGSSIPGLLPGMYRAAALGDQRAIDAQTDAVTAANDLMAQPTFVVGAPDLAGRTFVAGSYSSATSLTNTGVVTLQGDEDDVFIFTAVSDLIIGNSSSFDFIGGAQACNVFWRIGAQSSIGTDADFVGTLISYALVAVNTDATIDGRLISQTGAVTLLNNVFTSTACATGGDGDPLGGTTTPTAPSVTPVVPTLGTPPASAVSPTAVTPTAVTPAASGPTLAATGVEAVRPTLIGVLLALTGVILLTASRLRRSRYES